MQWIQSKLRRIADDREKTGVIAVLYLRLINKVNIVLESISQKRKENSNALLFAISRT